MLILYLFAPPKITTVETNSKSPKNNIKKD
jgi:hypothetical protein